MATRQSLRAKGVASVDPAWSRIRDEAEAAIRAEPLLGGMMQLSILHHGTLERALSYRISVKLA
jgi:serine O-acetyltransferase